MTFFVDEFNFTSRLLYAHVNAADVDIMAIKNQFLGRVLFKDKLFKKVLKADTLTSLMILEGDGYEQFW